PVIAATSMRWTFNDQFGVVAAFLRWVGYGQISWLAERWPSFLIVVFTDVWIWTPWFALILLAALKSLPREPFEAAQIDAAGRCRHRVDFAPPDRRRAGAGRQCRVLRAGACRRRPAVPRPRGDPGDHLAAAGLGGLLHLPRHRVHGAELSRSGHKTGGGA